LAARRTLLAFAVLVATLSAAPSASARQLPCGATVTTDTVLRGDLTACAGTALVIGGDNVVLDLHGHAVGGAIVASGVRDFTIRNGVVAGDVRLDRVRDAVVRRLRVRHGSITCVRSAGCTIARSVVTGGGIAIYQSESGVPNRIHGNLVRGAPGPGIAADRTDTTSIVANVVRRSGIGIEASHAADVRIAGNRLADNAGDGLSGSFGSAATIVDNLLASNGGDGISLRTWGGETLIAGNLAVGNGGNGIFGSAVAHWMVVENLAARNGEAGIAITGAVEDVKLTRNRTRLNGGPAQCVGTACS
jgi:hypothetical protein